MIASVGITNVGIASSETALEFEVVTQSNTINEYPVLHYCREGVTVVVLVKDSIGFYLQPQVEINNVRSLLPFAGYNFGDPIDGSENGLFCENTIFDSTGAIAIDAEGNPRSQNTMLGYNTTGSGSANAALITIGKGFLAPGKYSYQSWYDATASGGLRLADKGTFTITEQGLPTIEPPSLP